ncbi:Small GTPase superfamily [Carpediemonas membranifera]|uniref:Small GTPase superfamily n=1 Tax=Carpediemonas membranifera TaxID=201153 RepID=A0A8J6AT65_9EUKA|nr:Small GTPase superfamily [Carpediemonas membranifera]|eukprot:KAG9393463.1 Small GTPase superfamily [Carpediemonas membranifera]
MVYDLSIVVVGDECTNKTSFINFIANPEIELRSEGPSLSTNSSSFHCIDGRDFSVELIDTTGQEDPEWDAVLGLSLNYASAVIMLYSTRSKASLQSCRDMWYRRLSTLCLMTKSRRTDMPLILVGVHDPLGHPLFNDNRRYLDSTFTHSTLSRAPNYVSWEEATATARSIGAVAHFRVNWSQHYTAHTMPTVIRAITARIPRTPPNAITDVTSLDSEADMITLDAVIDGLRSIGHPDPIRVVTSACQGYEEGTVLNLRLSPVVVDGKLSHYTFPRDLNSFRCRECQSLFTRSKQATCELCGGTLTLFHPFVGQSYYFSHEYLSLMAAGVFICSDEKTRLLRPWVEDDCDPGLVGQTPLAAKAAFEDIRTVSTSTFAAHGASTSTVSTRLDLTAHGTRSIIGQSPYAGLGAVVTPRSRSASMSTIAESPMSPRLLAELGEKRDSREIRLEVMGPPVGLVDEGRGAKSEGSSPACSKSCGPAPPVPSRAQEEHEKAAAGGGECNVTTLPRDETEQTEKPAVIENTRTDPTLTPEIAQTPQPKLRTNPRRSKESKEHTRPGNPGHRRQHTFHDGPDSRMRAIEALIPTGNTGSLSGAKLLAFNDRARDWNRHHGEMLTLPVLRSDGKCAPGFPNTKAEMPVEVLGRLVAFYAADLVAKTEDCLRAYLGFD